MDITKQASWDEADLTEQTSAKNLVQFLIGWLKEPNGFAPLRRDGARCLRAATLALAEALKAVSQSINHKVAILLALETVNGMAKTAPMTDEALSQVAGRTDGGDQPTAPPKQKKARWRFW